jgi:hypothetical protein
VLRVLRALRVARAVSVATRPSARTSRPTAAAVAKAARFRLSQRAAVVVVGAMLRAGLALLVRLAPEDCPPGQRPRPVLPVRECLVPMPPQARITDGRAAVVVVVLQILLQASKAVALCGAVVVVDVAGIDPQRPELA